MNRWIPGWALLAGLAASIVCGTVTVMRNRRANRMRRAMRRAGKMLSQMSSAILHIFL